MIRRRDFLMTGLAGVAVPRFVRGQQILSLDFQTIADPDGWYPSLRLKGDWLIVAVSDGVFTGYGEASHSRDDMLCQRRGRELFAEHYRGLAITLENLAAKEREIAAMAPDFVTATALSGLNQALYDLLAKREGVPVWRLFRDTVPVDRIPLYATINRALATRTAAEYREIVGALHGQGFGTFKCAPFEAVSGPEDVREKSRPGLATLTMLRENFPDLRIRVDFHERYRPDDFFEMLPRLEELALDWIEEPFALGPPYNELQDRTSIRVAAGELYWGNAQFDRIVANGWADVIMPDVKHVGGFGPLVSVLDGARGSVEVSPHNPSGPISTAASLHAAVLHPQRLHSLEYAFDKRGLRRSTGERVENGYVYLSEKPGWGVEPPSAA